MKQIKYILQLLFCVLNLYITMTGCQVLLAMYFGLHGGTVYNLVSFIVGAINFYAMSLLIDKYSK